MNRTQVINGVSVGDVFRIGKNGTAVVTDILEKRSLVDTALKGFMCMARSTQGLSSNEFEVPFSTVIRNKKIAN